MFHESENYAIFKPYRMKNKQLQKILPMLIILVSLVLIGLFFASQKIASSESEKLAKEREQATQAENSDLGKQVKILFVGDIMLDRYIRHISEKKGVDFVFAGTQKILSENDLVVGNLEGPITNNPSVSVGSEIGAHDNYIFTFDQNVAADLWKNNIKLVNIGNNHILNFGADGLAQTKENLSSSKIDYFGDPADEKRIAIWNKNGLKLAFVNYNQFEKDGAAKALDEIQSAKKMNVDKIILYTHWGTEFVVDPDAKIKELAHGFIDSGADLIIGSHPHVIQSKEEYKGKMIYYSLGNFIFDQYFSPQTQQGLTVQIELNSKDKKIIIKEIQVILKPNGQTVKR